MKNKSDKDLEEGDDFNDIYEDENILSDKSDKEVIYEFFYTRIFMFLFCWSFVIIPSFEPCTCFQFKKTKIFLQATLFPGQEQF